MLLSVARLRLQVTSILLVILASLQIAYSREDSLFTTSVTYCAPPETLLIQQFDVTYIAWNNTIFFNISAASVEPNVNVTANMLINVYGMQPLDITVDLCSLLDGALCPLPMYNFTGTDWLSLPSSFGVQKKIPDIAFKIPDLEAFAQLSLTEVGTGKVKACIQSTLSNGWSTRQTGVEWSTVILALLALLSAIWQSHRPDALAPFRLLDLIFLYQSIALSAFLGINYPSVYLSFALNFAWSMGLVFASSMSPVQNAINRMRHLTGGNMADASGDSAVGLVNRKLSPYNVLPLLEHYPRSPLSTTDISPFNASGLSVLASTYSPASNGLSGVMQLAAGEVVTVTQASSNVLQAGVPIYVNSIFIATANAFMTVFFCVIILLAIALGVFALGYAGLFALNSRRGGSVESRTKVDRIFIPFVKAWFLRMCLVAFTPIATFSIYQWTLKDSWLSLLFSILLLLSICGYLLYPTILTIMLARRSGPHTLFTNLKHLTSNGPLFAQYRLPRYYFFLPLLVVVIIKAMIIGFAKNHGEVQVILMIIIEFFVLLAYIFLRPSNSRGGDVLGTYLTFVRLLASGLMVAFIERLTLAAIARVVVGIVIAVLFSVSVVVMAINILMHVYHGFRALQHPKDDQTENGSSGEQSVSESRLVSTPLSLVLDHDIEKQGE